MLIGTRDVVVEELDDDDGRCSTIKSAIIIRALWPQSSSMTDWLEVWQTSTNTSRQCMDR